MAHALARSAPDAATGGYLVPRPRPSDAMGSALRHAFGDKRSMPRDFDMLLARMDRLDN